MAGTLGVATLDTEVSLDGLDRGFSQAEGRTRQGASFLSNTLSFALGGIITQLAARATEALANVASFVVDAGRTMDNALDTIVVGTGATGEALEGLRGSFETVFTSIPTDAESAARAIQELNTRLGLTGEPLEQLSTGLLEATRLMGGDLQQNTQLFARVMGDWGVATEDAAGTLDTLFSASQATGAGMDSLMRQIVQFGAPMRLMGFEMEEAIALFGKWEQEGVNAELVMGSLRIAAGEFAREGVSLRDGLQQAMEAISSTTSESEALAIAMDVFGARAGPDMAAAIREGRFSIEELLEVMEDSQGAIARTAEQTNDFGEMWIVLRNKVTTALAPIGLQLIELANGIMPMLEEVIMGRIIPAIEAFVGWIDVVSGAVGSGGLATLFTVFEDGSSYLASFIEMLGVGEAQAQQIATAVLTLAEQIWTVVEPVIALIGQFVEWQDVMIALGAVLGVLAVVIIGPIVLAIAKISLIVAVVIGAIALLRNAWENNWLGIRDAVQAVIDFVVPLVQGAISSIREWWAANGDAILARAQQTWEAIKAAIEAAIRAAQAIIQAVTGAIQESWNRHGADIQASASNAWSAIRSFIEATINRVRDIIQTVANAIAAFWRAHGEAITAGARQAWQTIQQVIDLAMERIRILFDVFAAIFSGDWDAFLSSITELWQNSWDIILNVVQAFWEFLSPVIAAIVSEIVEALQPTIQNLQAKFQSVFSAIQGAIQPVVDLWNTFVSAVRGFWDWLRGKVFSINVSMPSLPGLGGQSGPVSNAPVAPVAGGPLAGLMSGTPSLSQTINQGGGVHIGQLILPNVYDGPTLLEQLQQLSVGGNA